MNLALGIDTGGTYTDAVVVEHDSGQLVASAKALTTRGDLSQGIVEAIDKVFGRGIRATNPFAPKDVVLVALSTTLATNALAEGHRGAVCLILIGYDPELMRQYGFYDELATHDVVHVRGGHNLWGDQVAPLDEEAVRRAVLQRREKVEAFAVSGYFGVRNPAHELRVRELIEELVQVPVTCGHELTSRLNSVRRATTATLNAHLIFPLRELIASVRASLRARQIQAPLMVVKGDGSLMRAAWAERRPIETILSGPAASVVGARRLAGEQDVWVVDMGGTTTDIGALEGGWPILNSDGARVGGWRTMVEAVDVHTTGLGGDSHVRVGREGGIHIGPRRVVSLSLLASEHPAVLTELRRQVSAPATLAPEDLGEFLVLGRHPGTRLAPEDRAILDSLASGPLSQATLAQRAPVRGLFRRNVQRLESQGLIRRGAFTPTDALHVLGSFDRWEAEAARLAAQLLAARTDRTVDGFCEHVVDNVANRIATELIGKVLEHEVPPDAWGTEPGAVALIRRALSGKDGAGLDCRLTLRRPIVAIGAPVGAYLPPVARRLQARLVIPEHAEVANALGAVAGGVIQRVRALINPLEDEEVYRLHLPDGVADFADLEDAVAHAETVLRPLVAQRARAAGAEQVETQFQRQDHWTPVLFDGATSIYLGTDLTFTAVGRPSPARLNRTRPRGLSLEEPFEVG